VSQLLTSTLVIRDATYKVSEMSGKTMAGVRKLLDSPDKGKLESYVVAACCLEPKFTWIEAEQLPQHVLGKLSSEAFRLTTGDEADAKND
jgi:hypothetical protein